jgi:hypothetical protein
MALSACGGSSGNARALLQQTFSGSHPVRSGDLRLALTVVPSGSRTLTAPLSLSFGGPFQSQGAGKLPKSDFSVTLSAQGKSGTVGILSTGTAGYVTLQGASYQLPQATFQRLESSFAQVASSPTGGGSSGVSKLGIHPLDWLRNPTIIGDETVGGTATTHIRAEIDVAALLGDLNTFLEKAPSLGISGASQIAAGLPSATREKIAAAVKSPTFDVWTGKDDKTLRKLTIRATVPVSGHVQALLGGLSSAQISLSMQYANLNQPQSISAPANVRPFAEFQSKLQSFMTTVAGGLSSAGTGASPAAPAPTSTTGSSAGVARYSQCIVKAHGDVTKMQACASLINGQ